MNKSDKALGRQALKYALAGVGMFCLGAAVFAAPAITPKAKVVSPSHDIREANTCYGPLGKAPAFQLGHASAGDDENCVRIARIVGRDGRVRDGRVHVTRGLICQE